MEFDRHTFYIACSYGMLALAMLVEIIMIRRRRQQALQHARTIAALKESP